MHEIISIDKPCDCIVAFAPEVGRPMCHTVCYQVHIDPAKLSPTGEYIRFDHSDGKGNPLSEIHGWKKVEEVLILEVLEEFAADSARPIEFKAA